MKISFGILIAFILNITFYQTIAKYLLVDISGEDKVEGLDPRKTAQIQIVPCEDLSCGAPCNSTDLDPELGQGYCSFSRDCINYATEAEIIKACSNGKFDDLWQLRNYTNSSQENQTDPCSGLNCGERCLDYEDEYDYVQENGFCNWNGTCISTNESINSLECEEKENATSLETEFDVEIREPTDKELDIQRALKRRDVMETCCQRKGVPDDCMGMCRNKREASFQSRSLERFQSRCAGLEHEIYSCYAESVSKVPEPEKTVPNMKKPIDDVFAEACNEKQCGDSCCGPECGWKEYGRCNYVGECIMWPESLEVHCNADQ